MLASQQENDIDNAGAVNFPDTNFLHFSLGGEGKLIAAPVKEGDAPIPAVWQNPTLFFRQQF